jgi:hypothetical protein
MEPIVKLAVAKALKEADIKLASKDLKPGQGEVDVTIHIKGVISKDADTERKDPIDYKHIAAMLAKKLGKKADDVLEECLQQKVLGVVPEKEIEQFKMAVENAAEGKDMPKKVVSGSVKANCIVEVTSSVVSWTER